MVAKITRAYVRHYRDNGQTTAYVEWLDHKGKAGRTEAPTVCPCCGREGLGAHMQALFDRAEREGVAVERETW
jgi:hypothetical protein